MRLAWSVFPLCVGGQGALWLSELLAGVFVSPARREVRDIGGVGRELDGGGVRHDGGDDEISSETMHMSLMIITFSSYAYL